MRAFAGAALTGLMLWAMAGAIQAAPKVSIVHGNVVCTENGQTRILTHDRKVDEAALSPDRHTVAFVRVLVKQVPYEIFTRRSELWLGDCHKPVLRKLVASKFSLEDASRNLGDPGELHFSPDGRTLYFGTSAAPTDGAVHMVDVATGKERFVVFGDNFRIFSSGPHRGDLLVSQHTCHETPGCDYPFYIFTPGGQRIAQIPDSARWDDKALARWLRTQKVRVQ